MKPIRKLSSTSKYYNVHFTLRRDIFTPAWAIFEIITVAENSEKRGIFDKKFWNFMQ